MLTSEMDTMLCSIEENDREMFEIKIFKFDSAKFSSENFMPLLSNFVLSLQRNSLNDLEKETFYVTIDFILNR
jgi:hypothetical protein